MRWAEKIADIALVFAGLWQFWAIAVVRLGGSFYALLMGLPLVLLGTGLLARWLQVGGGEGESPPLSEARPLSKARPWWIGALPWGSGLLVVGAWFGWYLAVLGWLPTWGLTVGHLLLCVALPVQTTAPAPPDRRLGPAIGLMAVLAVVMTLTTLRPDGDDGFYLGQVAGTLASPELPVLSFDVLHGDVSAPVQQPGHRAQTYEILVAAAAFCSPFEDHGNLYYVVFPVLFAGLFAVSSGLMLREMFGERVALYGLFGVLIISGTWAGVLVNPANFGLARLFQGKAVFASVWMPLIVWAAIRFSRAPDSRGWIRLLLGIFGSSMLSSSALVFAPIGAAFAVLAGISLKHRPLLAAAGGILAAVPSTLLLLVTRQEVRGAGALPDSGWTWHFEDYFGPDWRLPLSLAALSFLPVVARSLPGARWTARYVLLVFLVLINGWTGPRLAELSLMLEWRIYWTIPSLVLVGGALGGLGGLRLGDRPVGLVFSGLALLGFMMAGPWIGSTDNDASLGFPGWDVEPDAMAIADLAVLHDTTSPALLHHDVAIAATRHILRPPLIGVRVLYLRHLVRYFGQTETRRRVRLMKFTSGLLKKQRTAWALEEIDRRCILTVALHERVHRVYPDVDLTEGGFHLERVAGPYELWLREVCPEL